MTHSTSKRILALILLCTLLTVFCGEAFAEKAYVMKSAAFYSASGKKLGTIGAGATVDIVSEKSGWALVKKNGKSAIMKSSALAEIVDCSDFTAYTSASAAMYVNGKKVGTIPAGHGLTVTAKAGSWACVTYNGYSGLVKASQLTTTAPSANAPAATAAPQQNPVASKTVYANKAAKIYNASGKAIGTLPVNTQLTLTGINGSVCRVTKDGKTAYMKKSDLSDSKVTIETPAATPQATAAPEATAITVYANKNAKVYNASGKAVSAVAVNTELTLTGATGSVCRVVKDGKTGYMKKSDLSTTKVQVSEPANQIIAYAKQDNTKVYNNNGKVISTVAVNTAVTVTGINGNICRVVKDGVTAYMNKADLSNSKVEVNSNVVDIPNTTGYVKTEGAKVYDINGNAIASLSVNTAVTVSAYSDILVEVVNGSITGYMKKEDISTSKVEVSNASYSLKYGDSGEAVKRLQTRLKELGWFSGNVGGNYLGLTQSAVVAFQSAAKLTANGVADYKTLEVLFSDSAPKYTKPATDTVTPSGNSTVTPAKGTAVAADWWTSDIQKLFPRGSTVTVTDVATGLAWREYRGGGTNHADVQPATKADTAVLKKVYGGKWSWNRRAIFVTINGINYAASMNGMPHGGGSISSNGFNGHHCIHFTNSRTHGSNKVCSLHQNAIKKALNAVL